MYLCPLAEVIGKLPVRSVEIIPCSESNLIVWAPTLWLWRFCRCAITVGVSLGARSGVGSVSVGLITCRRRWRWPSVVSSESGRCFHTSLLVRPGHVMHWPLSMALVHVAFVGNPANAWRYNVSSGFISWC